MNRRLPALLPILAVVIAGVSSIRVSHLIVPAQVGRGHDAQLHCHFNLGGNILYSVKWFKGSQEFFRIGPDGSRPQVFPHLSNLTVDQRVHHLMRSRVVNVFQTFAELIQRSNLSTVYLKNIQRSNAGTYRCEVSCEGPHFETDFREANMSVIDLPLQGPIIINVQTSYLPGERVSLNCTSAPSKPMAILQWSIDGEQMSEPHVKRYMDGSMTLITTASKQFEVNNARHQVDGWSPNAGRDDMSETSDFIGGGVEDNNSVATVGLEFVVDLPKEISTGVLAIRRVSCTAFVGDIYKAITYANLSIVDGRSSKAVATVRTPSHLLHSSNGSSGKWRSWNSTWINAGLVVFSCLFQLMMRPQMSIVMTHHPTEA